MHGRDGLPYIRYLSQSGERRWSVEVSEVSDSTYIHCTLCGLRRGPVCFISFLACGSQLPREFIGQAAQVKDFLVLFVFSSMPAGLGP